MVEMVKENVQNYRIHNRKTFCILFSKYSKYTILLNVLLFSIFSVFGGVGKLATLLFNRKDIFSQQVSWRPLETPNLKKSINCTFGL